MSDKNGHINPNSFGPGQQELIAQAMETFITALINTAPQLGPHFLSGGVMSIATMSGAVLKFGFAPQRGGLVLPGGIRPHVPPSKGFPL
jgi:hypothetical protein